MHRMWRVGVFISFYAEHGASHCFLPQSPRHESPGVPHVILLIVVFVIPVPEPRVSFPAHSRHRHPETALPRRQTPQGHQWAGGDGEDLCQSQWKLSRNVLICFRRSVTYKSMPSESSTFVSVWRTHSLIIKTFLLKPHAVIVVGSVMIITKGV